MALYINGKREGGDGSDPQVFSFTGAYMTETVVHDLGRRVHVSYFNAADEEVEVAVCHVDDDTVQISSVQFLNGYALIS